MKKVRLDDDVVELQIEVSDGTSTFVNWVYVGHAALAKTVADLRAFKDQVHGGLLDIRFGEFGPEWASGAFHARFHFPRPGKLHITCQQESDFRDFAIKKVASHATLYLMTEPVLLDSFVAEIGGLSAGNRDEANLEAQSM